MEGLEAEIQRVLPDTVELRRDLHAYPELSFQERRTADRIAGELDKIDTLTIRRNVAGTGIVALLEGGQDGPCVGLRADMDALPIQEETSLPHASRNPGVMHACGHDGHSSCLLGVARVLAGLRERIRGPVKFIFQPAEEDGAGGNEMVKAGVLRDPDVEAVFALHAAPSLSVGSIGVGSGPVHAATNPFEITVCGQSAHGAYPHEGVDSVVAAAAIVTALQTVCSRNVDPLHTAVVTVGKIHGGEAINILAGRCTLQGTIRTLDPEVRRFVLERVRAVAESIAQAHGARAEVDIVDGYPVTHNDPNCAAFVARIARERLGENHVVTNLRPSMGAEDFAYYAREIPAAIFRLGMCPAGAREYPKLHTPFFDFNDDALPVGIDLLSRIALAYGRR